MDGAAWEIVRLLPNLALPPASDQRWAEPAYAFERLALTLRSDCVAIVPPDDPRVLEFADRFPVSRVLLGAFKDAYGHRTSPSVLIARESGPIKRSMDTISAFRNAVAFSFILRASADRVGCAQRGAATWSDLFDFHPAQVDRLGSIQIHSAALLHIVGTPEALAFSPSPFVDASFDFRFCDVGLSELLSKAWHRGYVRRRMPRGLASVFRSLQVAYQAAAVPVRNAGSLADFGLSVAQWVSALETLLWPVNGRANQYLSLLQLGRLAFEDPRLNARRYTVMFGRKAMRVSFIQKALTLVYRARNAFLHGEPFSKGDLEPWRHRGSNLVLVAAIVYRFALLQQLRVFFPPRPVSDLADLTPERVISWYTDSVFERALLLSAGYDPHQ